MNPLGNSKVAHLTCVNLALQAISINRARALALSWEFFKVEEEKRKQEIADLKYKVMMMQKF